MPNMIVNSEGGTSILIITEDRYDVERLMHEHGKFDNLESFKRFLNLLKEEFRIDSYEVGVLTINNAFKIFRG